MPDENQIHLLEKIDRYLLGEMDKNELRDFEQLSATNPNVAAEIEKQQQLNQKIENEAERLMKARLRDTYKVVSDIKKKVIVDYDQFVADTKLEEELSAGITATKVIPFHQKRQLLWVYAIAASIVLLLIPTYFFLFQGPSDTQLYAAYYTPYPDVVSGIVRSEARDMNDVQTIMSKYERGEFKDALNLLNAFLNENPKEYDLIFYQALIQLELDKSELAIARFKEVIKANDDFTNQAEWYLTLAYLKSGNRDKAETTLQAIIQKNNDYSTKAKKLSEQL